RSLKGREGSEGIEGYFRISLRAPAGARLAICGNKVSQLSQLKGVLRRKVGLFLLRGRFQLSPFAPAFALRALFLKGRESMKAMKADFETLLRDRAGARLAIWRNKLSFLSEASRDPNEAGKALPGDGRAMGVVGQIFGPFSPPTIWVISFFRPHFRKTFFRCVWNNAAPAAVRRKRTRSRVGVDRTPGRCQRRQRPLCSCSAALTHPDRLSFDKACG